MYLTFTNDFQVNTLKHYTYIEVKNESICLSFRERDVGGLTNLGLETPLGFFDLEVRVDECPELILLTFGTGKLSALE